MASKELLDMMNDAIAREIQGKHSVHVAACHD
jgi:hypothetical protein